jgi:hypothetical protein
MGLTKTHNRMIADAPVSANDYGAVGDGVTDDTAAIQAALDSGASLVNIGTGHYIVSSVLTVPLFVSFIGSGISTASSTLGTTLLYNGTGECIRSIGTVNVVPAVFSEIGNFRIRKIVQASTLAAVAQIAGFKVTIRDIRIDTDDGAYSFKYGVVFDQTEVSSIHRVDVTGSATAGKMTAAFFFTNGDEYTTGNLTNVTNAITMYDCNINSPDYGILHNGGEGFRVVGGNFNASHIANCRLAGLNSFSIENAYMEGSTGTADILIAQSKTDGTSTGTGGGGTIMNCRLSSSTTNCIQFENASIQTTGFVITGNKFGSSRTGSAIAVPNLTDGLRASFIGPNVNLGGSTKNYLDANVYTYNRVTTPSIYASAQLEPVQATFIPGGIISSSGSGKRVSVTAYNRITGSPYVVLDTDHQINITNNSGVALNFTLPTGLTQDGRELTFTQVVGTNDTNIAGKVLNAVGDTVTIRYDHANTAWRIVASIGV